MFSVTYFIFTNVFPQDLAAPDVFQRKPNLTNYERIPNSPYRDARAAADAIT
jgi:hypothetical protein